MVYLRHPPAGANQPNSKQNITGICTQRSCVFLTLQRRGSWDVRAGASVAINASGISDKEANEF